MFPHSLWLPVHFLRSACLLGALLFLAGNTARTVTPPKKTNLLVVVARDLGFSDLGCYGGEMQTPYVDYLAARGVRFTQAYHAGTGTAEQALLTGFYPQHLSGEESASETGSGDALPPRPAWAFSLPEALKASGYRCYHSGVWSMAGTPEAVGFERSFALLPDGRFRPQGGVEGAVPSVAASPGEAVAGRLCDFLRAHAEQTPGKPFFALAALGGSSPNDSALSSPDPGRFDGGQEAVCRERLEKLWSMGMLLNAELTSRSAANFGVDRLQRGAARPSEFQRRMVFQAARVEQMDRQVGRILEQIKAMGLWEQTAVFFLSESSRSEGGVAGDSGAQVPLHVPLRESVCGLHEAGIATPLVVHWPGGIRARGETRETFVHVVDLAPTFLKIAGVPWPKKAGEVVPGADGVDLTLLLREGKTLGPRALWWEHAGSRAFRLGDWKWVAPKEKPVELYYLKEDRSETRDLAELNLERVQEMEIQWTRMAERFRGDLQGGGPVPSSEGKAKKPER